MSDRTTISVSGLTLQTNHGVTDLEQDAGQTLIVDLDFAPVDEPGALWTDDVLETVDYGLVSERVAALATGKRYRTLEALISDIADALIAEFGLGWIRIRATKPVPPLALEFSGAGGVSVTLERSAG